MADDAVERTLDLTDDGAAPAPKGFVPGASIGHFRIARELGAGGMGVVFEAYDPDLDRRVAIKVVRDRDAGSAAGRRLIGEAQAMAKLAHPNVVSVHEVGTIASPGFAGAGSDAQRRGEPIDDQVFVVMELVAGETLAGWLAVPRGWRDIVRVFGEAGDGLAAAHEAGLVHGDFKPANVLIDAGGRARVADFGLARTDDRERRFAAGSRPAGTPGYMAPEQLAGEPFDACADQYAFAVALRQALQHARVPRRIRGAIDRALSPDPAARFPTTSALLGELRAALRTRRRAVAAAVAIAAGSGAIAVVVTRTAAPARDDCFDGVTLVDDVWTAAARDARGHTPSGATTTRLLDDWADAWRLGRRTACAAEPAERAGRLACLDGALAELRAQLAVGVRAGDSELTAVAGLPSPAACAVQPPPPSPVAGVLVDRIARVDALQRAGRSADARPQLASLVADATALGDPAMIARARIAAGTVERDIGALADADRDFAAAARDAARAGTDLALLDAMIMQASVATDRGRALEAVGVLDAAGAIVARVGDVRADKLALARGDALTQAGRFPEAIVEDRRAVAILEPLAQREPAARVRLAAALGALAAAEGLSFHYGDALALLQRTLAIEEADDGPEHPEVGKTLHDLANNEARLRLFDDARVHYERARGILAKAYGERSEAVALTDYSIGTMELQRNRGDAARTYYDRALGELVAAAPDSPELSRIELGLGAIDRDGDRCRDAIPHFERSLAVLQRIGRGGTDLAINLTDLGACLADVGRDAEARPTIERALAAFAAAGVPERERCEPNAIYAEIEWRAGHRDRAIAIARGVIAVTEGAGEPYTAIHDEMARELAVWTRR